MYRSVRQQIFSLPDSCLLYPAHDYRGLTGHQRRRRAPVQPASRRRDRRSRFHRLHEELRLAHPKKMDVAVPANLKCGRPETDPAAAEDPIWAPLKYTFAGIWEIDPLGSKSMPRRFRSSMCASRASLRAHSGTFAARD